MELVLKDTAIEDIVYFKKTGNKNIQKKISLLISDTLKNPYSGLGKPEMLKHEFTGFWSRRITIEHRMVYVVVENELHVISLRGHY